MAWSRGRTAAALAVGVLSALGNAQAFFGGDQSASCSVDDDWVNLGCYFGNYQTTLTPFTPENYDPANPGASYPGFNSGNDYNATVTPQSCVQVCRGYGYRTATLINSVCGCGYGVPPNIPPAVTGTCNVACNGDSSQSCGGTGDTQIFLDPTFVDAAVLAADAQLFELYQYLGCFYMPDTFPTMDSINTVTTQNSPELCLTQCASLRYPLARASPVGSAGQVTCECGETFNFGDYRVVEGEELTPGSCGTNCINGLLGTCDPEVDFFCCGSNNYYSVYINPELEGCYTPSIPGYGQLDSSNVPTAFICGDVPASLTSGPQAFTATNSYGAYAKVTEEALPVHSVTVDTTVGQLNFYEFGCYVGAPAVVFTNPQQVATGGIDLRSCATLCSGFSYFGVTNGDECYCSNTIATASAPGPMALCNIQCSNDDTQFCGGASTVEVYAIEGNWDNNVALSIQSTVIATPYPSSTCQTNTGTSGTAEPTGTTGTAEPTGTSGTAEPTGTTGTGEPTGTSGTAEPTDTTGTAEPTGTTGTAEPTDTTGTAEPTGTTGTAESTGTETGTAESTGTGTAESTGTETGTAESTATGTGTAESTGTETGTAESTGTETGTAESTATGTGTVETSATGTATVEPTETAQTSETATETVQPTETGDSTTAPSSTPTVPPTGQSIIFAVAALPPNNTLVRRHARSSLRNKRQFQVGDGFLGGAGPVNPTDCTLATPFNLTDGTLSSGGQLISTDPGIAYQPFFTNAAVGAITTTFAIQDGNLVWLNDAFVGGAAGFCQANDGQVWITFDGNPPPFDCTPVALVPFATSQCQNGGIVTVTSTATSVTISTTVDVSTTTAPTTTPGPCTSGSCLGNGTLTLGPGTFFADAVATTPIAQCVIRTESWIYGQTTLLPSV